MWPSSAGVQILVLLGLPSVYQWSYFLTGLLSPKEVIICLYHLSTHSDYPLCLCRNSSGWYFILLFFFFSQLLFLVDQQPGDWWVNFALSSFPCDIKLILTTGGLCCPSTPSSSQEFTLLASCLWPHSSSSTTRSVLQPCLSVRQCK